MSYYRIKYEPLLAYCTEVLSATIPRQEAEVVAHNLISADLSGFYSHGICKISDYLIRMEEGLVARHTDVQLERETHTTAVFNANNGWGAYASKIAMETAIDKALEYGSGFTTVNNSNHFGMTSYYTKMAADSFCIGFATTNASSLVVPFGAREPSLGTNPISIAVPRGNGKQPIILDMSTSVTARGRITLAKKLNETVPDDWAITKDGRKTTDPTEALDGYLLPMGPKGSGLAIMMDILSGVLSGALFGNHVPRMYEDKEPQNLGHMFGAISIESFMDRKTYIERIEDRFNQTVNSKPMEGFERVYSPGEIEQENYVEQMEKGVRVPKGIYNELSTVGKKYGVNIDSFINIINN